MPSSLLLAALVLSAHSPAAAAPRSPAPTPRADAPIEIPLRPLFGRLRTVRARVGEDSLDFLFDTGNGTTLVSPELAAKLGGAPVGRAVGFRMTGEQMAGPRCEGVKIDVGGARVEATAGIVDMTKLLGRPAPGVQGVLSLQAFAGRVVTLDLAHERLVVETPASLAERTRTMRRVPARLATGVAGADLYAFVGVPTGATTLWLEWDSGHQASTFLAPHAARLLGVPDSLRQADTRLALGGDTPVTPPERDPTGVYETVADYRGQPQRGVLSLQRVDGALRGSMRGIGEDDVVALRDVSIAGRELRYTLPLREAAPSHVVFDGVEGTGTWGDVAAGHGGALRAVKRADAR